MCFDEVDVVELNGRLHERHFLLLEEVQNLIGVHRRFYLVHHMDNVFVEQGDIEHLVLGKEFVQLVARILKIWQDVWGDLIRKPLEKALLQGSTV